ncbi:Protein of unknown function [Gryllus bimaculatus]|nr:Protein of unknown function [Gryllus bimaculatus]
MEGRQNLADYRGANTMGADSPPAPRKAALCLLSAWRFGGAERSPLRGRAASSTPSAAAARLARPRALLTRPPLAEWLGGGTVGAGARRQAGGRGGRGGGRGGGGGGGGGGRGTRHGSAQRRQRQAEQAQRRRCAGRAASRLHGVGPPAHTRNT